MGLNKNIERLHNSFEEHEYYIRLQNEYSENLLYKEIIHFMNMAFPEWNSNNGIGYHSAEFILTSIENLEHLQNEDEYTQKQLLIDCYTELAFTYNKWKTDFSFQVKNIILDEFNKTHLEDLEDKEHLPSKDFDAYYSELYSIFNKYFLNQKPYYY